MLLYSGKHSSKVLMFSCVCMCLCSCVCKCLCVQVCAHVCKDAWVCHTWIWRQEVNGCPPPWRPTSILNKVTQWTWRLVIRIDWLAWKPTDHPMPTWPVLDLQDTPLILWFYKANRNSTQVLRFAQKSALLTEPTPQTPNCAFWIFSQEISRESRVTDKNIVCMMWN